MICGNCGQYLYPNAMVCMRCGALTHNFAYCRQNRPRKSCGIVCCGALSCCLSAVIIASGLFAFFAMLHGVTMYGFALMVSLGIIILFAPFGVLFGTIGIALGHARRSKNKSIGTVTGLILSFIGLISIIVFVTLYAMYFLIGFRFF